MSRQGPKKTKIPIPNKQNRSNHVTAAEMAAVRKDMEFLNSDQAKTPKWKNQFHN